MRQTRTTDELLAELAAIDAERCDCGRAERMAETPDDDARCAYCGGRIAPPELPADAPAGATVDDDPDGLAAELVAELDSRGLIDHEREDRCEDCGHHEDDHDRRAEDGECFRCNGAADLGLYAPCAYTGPGYDPTVSENAHERAAAGGAWAGLLRSGDYARRLAVLHACLTADELATAAARSGLVPDPGALPVRERPTVGQRHRELGDAWAHVEASRRNPTARLYEESDGFEERTRVRFDPRPLPPIYSAGAAGR